MLPGTLGRVGLLWSAAGTAAERREVARDGCLLEIAHLGLERGDLDVAFEDIGPQLADFSPCLGELLYELLCGG